MMPQMWTCGECQCIELKLALQRRTGLLDMTDLLVNANSTVERILVSCGCDLDVRDSLAKRTNRILTKQLVVRTEVLLCNSHG